MPGGFFTGVNGSHPQIVRRASRIGDIGDAAWFIRSAYLGFSTEPACVPTCFPRMEGGLSYMIM